MLAKKLNLVHHFHCKKARLRCGFGILFFFAFEVVVVSF